MGWAKATTAAPLHSIRASYRISVIISGLLWNERSTVYLLLLVTAAGLLISTFYLILTRFFTRAIMHITLILSILLNVCVNTYSSVEEIALNLTHTGGYASTTGSPSTTVRPVPISVRLSFRLKGINTAGAIIFTVIALLSIFSYWGYRSRIPLASLLLQIVMDVSKHHLSVYVVAFVALFLQALLSVYVRFPTLYIP